jgi:hypothetical protein
MLAHSAVRSVLTSRKPAGLLPDTSSRELNASLRTRLRLGWLKVVLTYATPVLVSNAGVLSATRTRLLQARPERNSDG